MLIKIINSKNLLSLIILLLMTITISNSEELVIEIDNPKFSEKDLNDNTFEIKAKKGLKSENNLELFVVEGKFKSDNNGKWIYLKADEGIFSQIKKFIELKNNIVFYTDEGETLKSDYATFDMENDVIKLRQGVSHESYELLILSDNSIITENFNKINYAGNVISIIKNFN